MTIAPRVPWLGERRANNDCAFNGGARYGFCTLKELHRGGGGEEFFIRRQKSVHLAADPVQAGGEAGGGSGHDSLHPQPPPRADGGRLLPIAKEILQLKQQFEESSSKSFSGSHYIHLGIEHTIARAILPHVLPRFLADHPDTFVKLSEESPSVMQKSISYEGVDLVIGSLGSVPDKFEAIPLCRKEHLLVVPKELMAALAGDKLDETVARFSRSADLSFFESAPFIKIPRQSSGGRALGSYLKYYDISPRFVCELTNIENAFQLANSGVGVFIYAKVFWDMLSPELQADYLKNIYIFPLPYLPDIEDVCAYYNRDAGISGMTQELFESVKAFFEEYKARQK